MKKTAIITGASSGIGKAYAEKLASLNYNLIITGRRKKLLAEVKDNLSSKYNLDVKMKIIELSDRQKLDEFLSEIEMESEIDVLVNNAGFGTLDTFLESSTDIELMMIDVHIKAVVLLTKTVLKKMNGQGRGVIINISSIGAFLPIPKNVIYAATKSFLVAFSEALKLEIDNKNIKIQVLCPGFTKTDFHSKLGININRSKYRKIKWMTPEKVVKISWNCIKTDKVICYTNFKSRVLLLYHALFKKNYYRLIKRLFK